MADFTLDPQNAEIIRLDLFRTCRDDKDLYDVSVNKL
jgi:hypothetical protein